MKDFIGTLARMYEVNWATSITEMPETRYSYQKAAAKTWAFVQARPDETSLREWDINLTSGNASTSILMGYATGEYGPGPFRFVSSAAALTNVLTPAQSRLASKANGGTFTGPSGTAQRSLVAGTTTPTIIADQIPVIPGKPITATVDAAGPTILEMDFRTITGARVGTLKKIEADGVLAQRISGTVPVVPATARYLQIRATGFTSLAFPQVTYTPYVVPWAVGAGATSVVVDSVKREIIRTQKKSHDTFWRVSAKIVEVG